LGLIEECDVLDWGSQRIDKTIVAKVMDILDERLHLTACALLLDSYAECFVPNYLVTRERLAQYRD
jgi:hypothetical protein